MHAIDFIFAIKCMLQIEFSGSDLFRSCLSQLLPQRQSHHACCRIAASYAHVPPSFAHVAAPLPPPQDTPIVHVVTPPPIVIVYNRQAHMLSCHFQSRSSISLIEEIAINYVKFEELHDQKTINVYNDFIHMIFVVINERILNQSPWQSPRSVQIGLNGKNNRDGIALAFEEASTQACYSHDPQIYPVGSKWVFIQMRDANNMIVRYKVRLVAQHNIPNGYSLDSEIT